MQIPTEKGKDTLTEASKLTFIINLVLKRDTKSGQCNQMVLRNSRKRDEQQVKDVINLEKSNLKYLLREGYTWKVNTTGEDPESILWFISSMLFPNNSSSWCWLPDPQRQEEYLMLSLCLASPIATAENQQGGNNYHGAGEEAPVSDPCIY